MSNESPYDPRAIANLIIANCKSAERPVTNLALQKLLYFAHGLYLLRNRKPLVQGYFEAWQHGPVHPAAYAAFKNWGSRPINEFAQRKDIRTGVFHKIEVPDDREALRIIAMTVDSYGSYTAGQLVRLSHAKNGPWDVVLQRSASQKLIGLRISNDLIADRFRFHKASACNLEDVIEPDEDTPLTNYGFG